MNLVEPFSKSRKLNKSCQHQWVIKKFKKNAHKTVNQPNKYRTEMKAINYRGVSVWNQIVPIHLDSVQTRSGHILALIKL